MRSLSLAVYVAPDISFIRLNGRGCHWHVEGLAKMLLAEVVKRRPLSHDRHDAT